MNASDSINSALDKLIASTEHRSISAQFRDVYPTVEKALRAGVPASVVLATLKEQGLSMTMSNFKSALYRLRRERRSTAPSESRRLNATQPGAYTPKSNDPVPDSSPPMRTINNPEDLRRARAEPVNLDDYLK